MLKEAQQHQDTADFQTLPRYLQGQTWPARPGAGNVNRALNGQNPFSCFYFKLQGATQSLWKAAGL